MSIVTFPETVTFTVQGSNPQTFSVQVIISVDTTTGLGTGSASFTYNGNNSGQDTVQASMPAFGISSNDVAVNWQQTNGLLSLGNNSTVSLVSTPYPGWSLFQGTQAFSHGNNIPLTATLTVGTLMFNTNNNGFGPGPFAAPAKWENVTAVGTDAGTGQTFLPPGNNYPGNGFAFQWVYKGNLVVAQAGNYELDIVCDDSYILGFGTNGTGGTVTRPNIAGQPSNNQLVGFQTGIDQFGASDGGRTIYQGFPIVMVANASNSTIAGFAGGNGPGAPFFRAIVNFSQPGIYPFEIDYNNYQGACEFQMTYNGGGNRLNGLVFRPVTIQVPPSQPPVGGGALQLLGGPTTVLIQGNQLTLNLNISNVHFATQSYMPILEGIPGQVYVYNDPVNNVFTFPSFYGSTPDGPSAAANDFYLASDNTAWQGQLSLRWDATKSQFELFYNGSQQQTPGQLFQPNVQSTTLTVTQEDIAWFNPANKSYDVFQVTTGGGKIFNIPVFYLFNPNFPTGAAVIVSPTTVTAGTSPNFTVTLARPLPPLQNNVAMSVQFTGTQPTSVSVTPNFGTIGGIANWLISYTVSTSWANATIASTSTMTFSFTAPNITFLGATSVDTFGTLNNYSFVGTKPSITITVQPDPNVPENVGLQELNAGQQLQPGSVNIGAVTTLIATWTSGFNNFQNTTFYITPFGGKRIALGTVPASSATIMSIGGGQYQATFRLDANTIGYTNANKYQFSYVGVCADTSSVSYTDSMLYPSNNPQPQSKLVGGLIA